MSNILAFDTSSPLLSVALQKKGGTAQETLLEGFMNHAENLIPIMDELLQQENLTLHDIDTFVIGRGPGSFTGLRVGFATLKGLLAGRIGLKTFGVMSFDTIAAGIPVSDEPLAVCLDARREKFYLKIYENQGGAWQSSTKAEILSFEEVASKLPAKVILVGEALDRHKEKFEELPKKITFLSQNEWYPKASTLIALYREHETSASPFLEELKIPEDFIPAYFRLSEPEERLKER